jgi:hypothetical protein
MRVFSAAALATVLASAALAQSQPVPRYGDINKEKTPQEIEAERQTEKAYRSSLGNIPDKGPSDPWGQVRSGNAAKESATGPAKAAPVQRARTGNVN